MNSPKTTARIVGALFLIVMFTYSLGAFIILDPILNAPDYLLKVSANQARVITGVLLELINGIAYIGIAVLVYPIIKQLNESLALGYLSFRIIEFAMQIVSDLSPLLLTTMGQEFVTAEAPDASSIQALGTLLLSQRYWANQMVFITYCLGAMIFYYLLYQLKLIPRFLSVWGLIGVPMVLINVMLGIFGLKQVMVLGLIMGLNEIVLGVWLILKGFNSSNINSRSIKTE